MYESPTIEMLGHGEMTEVYGAFVWAVGPVVVAAAAVVAAVVVWVV